MKTKCDSVTKIIGATLLCIVMASLTAQCGTTDWKAASSAWSQSLGLEQKGDLDGALAKMTDFYRASSDIYLTNLRTGWLYYRKQKYTQSAEAYQMASSAQPTALNPLLGMANAYRAARDATRAAQMSEKVLALDPVNYSALLMLGGIHYERQDFQRALKTYKTLLDAYPEDTAALSGTGWTLLKMNMKREAAENFLRLASIAPWYPSALQGLSLATGVNAGSAASPSQAP